MSFFSLFKRSEPAPINAKARLNSVLKPAEELSRLDKILQFSLPRERTDVQDNKLFEQLDKEDFPWKAELASLLASKKINNWITALTTYKDTPATLAIVLHVIVKLMDEAKDNKLHKLVNTPRVHALLLSQLSNTDGAQNERLFFNGTYLLGRLLQDDYYKCDNAPTIIMCMLNIIEKYNKSDGIVEYALTIIDILKGCVNTYLAPESILRTQLVEGSILRSVDPEQGENVILAQDIIKHVIKMTTIEYDGGRRRTHKKRRALKKTRRSRK